MFLIKLLGYSALVALSNICWTKYIHFVNVGKALKAALWESGIIVIGAVSFVLYLEDRRFIIGSLIGGFIATYYSVKHKHKPKDDQLKILKGQKSTK